MWKVKIKLGKASCGAVREVQVVQLVSLFTSIDYWTIYKYDKMYMPNHFQYLIYFFRNLPISHVSWKSTRNLLTILLVNRQTNGDVNSIPAKIGDGSNSNTTSIVTWPETGKWINQMKLWYGLASCNREKIEQCRNSVNIWQDKQVYSTAVKMEK